MEKEIDPRQEAYLESIKAGVFGSLKDKMAVVDSFIASPPEGGTRTGDSIKDQLESLNSVYKEAETAYAAQMADLDKETGAMLEKEWKELQERYGLLSEKLMAGAGWQ